MIQPKVLLINLLETQFEESALGGCGEMHGTRTLEVSWRGQGQQMTNFIVKYEAWRFRGLEIVEMLKNVNK